MTGVQNLEWATNPKDCRVVGIPVLYLPLTKYTFAIVSDHIVSRKVYVSGGVIVGSSKTGPNTSPEVKAAEEAVVASSKDAETHDHSAHAHRQLGSTENDATGSCFDCGRPAYGSVLYDWISPAAKTGTITFAALCGGSKVGAGGAGFVRIAQHVTSKETYKHSSSMGHTCTQGVVTGLAEYEMSGLKAKDEADAMNSGGSHAGHGAGHGDGHSMVMVFNQWNLSSETTLPILFEGWNVTNGSSYTGAIVALFLLGVSVRLFRIPLLIIVRRDREATTGGSGIGINKCNTRKVGTTILVWVSFFCLQALSYWVMLATMVYDIGLFIAILSGLSTGFVLENNYNYIQTSRKKKMFNSPRVADDKQVELASIEAPSSAPDENIVQMEKEVEAKFGDCCEVEL